MKLSKDARKLSKQLFQLCLVDHRVSDERVRTIVSKLVAEKPRDYLSILKALNRLLRFEIAKHHAIVESAVDLSPEEMARATEKLHASHGNDLTTTFKTNPDLLGGLRIRIGSDVFDGSVQGRLQQLEKNLAA